MGQRYREGHCHLKPQHELAIPLGVADHVAIARAKIGDAIPPETWQRLEAIDDRLPPLATEAAVELRLDDGGAEVDFELCLGARDGTPEKAVAALGNLGDDRTGGTCQPLDAAWERARRFLAAWNDPTSPQHDAVPVIWLEFDVPLEGRAEPFVVVTVDATHTHPDGTPDAAAIDSILFGSLDVIAGGLDAATRSSAATVVAGLPPTACVTHAAVRPTQAGDIVRFVLRMRGIDVCPTLERIGWPGDVGELQELLDRFGFGEAGYGVNLDVLPGGLGPRVGMEVHHPSSAAIDPRWQRALDELERTGACTPSARRVVEDWYFDPYDTSAADEAATSERWLPLVVRREQLIKIVHEPGKQPRAKAYLTLGPRLAAPGAATWRAPA